MAWTKEQKALRRKQEREAAEAGDADARERRAAEAARVAGGSRAQQARKARLDKLTAETAARRRAEATRRAAELLEKDRNAAESAYVEARLDDTGHFLQVNMGNDALTSEKNAVREERKKLWQRRNELGWQRAAWGEADVEEASEEPLLPEPAPDALRRIHVRNGRGDDRAPAGGRCDVLMQPDWGLPELKREIRRIFGKLPYHIMGTLMRGPEDYARRVEAGDLEDDAIAIPRVRILDARRRSVRWPAAWAAQDPRMPRRVSRVAPASTRAEKSTGLDAR